MPAAPAASPASNARCASSLQTQPPGQGSVNRRLINCDIIQLREVQALDRHLAIGAHLVMSHVNPFTKASRYVWRRITLEERQIRRLKTRAAIESYRNGKGARILGQ